jgi:hypothetical protein
LERELCSIGRFSFFSYGDCYVQNASSNSENTKLDRFHPIVFRWNPQPSADAGEPVSRYKSAAHCTGGFKTIEEAQAAIASHNNWWPTGEVFSWDGEDIPAMIRWYENKL